MPIRNLAGTPSALALLLVAPLLAAENIINSGSVLLTPLAEGIYAVEPKFAGANGALILNETGNIVVDTHGSPASARALIRAMSRISDQPVRYVINTHWHVDHNSGNEAYKAAYGDGVVFIAHDETRKEIPTLGAKQFTDSAPYRTMPIQSAEAALSASTDSHGQALTDEQIADISEFRDGQTEFAAREGFEFTLPNLTFSQSITLHGQPNTAEVFYLYPGHTKTDSIVYLRNQQVLIVGDLLTKPILWTWASHPSSYIRTLTELEQLPIQKIVIGHGGPVLENKDYLVQAREFLEAVVEYSEKSLAAGHSEEETITAAADRASIQDFRRRFVTEQEDSMFDRMVSWTVSRSYLELSAESSSTH